MSSKKGALIRYALAVSLWGVLGLFVRNIALPSSVIALGRAIIGVCFLALVLLISKKKSFDWAFIRRNFKYLLITGICIGANWVFLFEAYRYTTVAVATLCYYMAPVIVVMAAPIVLHEKLSSWQLACVGLSVLGMVLVSGVLDGSALGSGHGWGIALGLGAAALYATGILSLRRMDGVGSYDMTITEMGIAFLVLLPYVLATVDLPALSWDPRSMFFLLFIGIMSTGVAYTLYFSSMKLLDVQTVAIWGYLDPVIAIFCSAVLLHEGMSLLAGIGALLVLGATLASQLEPKKA